jgi:hypothetical protein
MNRMTKYVALDQYRATTFTPVRTEAPEMQPCGCAFRDDPV